jgi:hypothetical protein
MYQPILEALEQRFSQERLQPYKLIVAEDLSQAIELYQWNAQVSAAFWVTLGHIEVLVRNAMHEHLMIWARENYGDHRWYIDYDGVFTGRALADIAKARERAREGKRKETPGRVVAGLTLGFWRYLLIKHYDRTLWISCLRHVWPTQPLRQNVHDQLAKLNELRNRIAHQEPIFNRDLSDLHTTALTVARWTCPETAGWIEKQSTVSQLLSQRPTVRIPRTESSPASALDRLDLILERTRRQLTEASDP